MPGIHRWTATALVLTGVLALGACGTTKHTTADSTAAKPRGTMVLYSGQHEQTTTKLVNAFEKQSGVRVKVRFDDEAVLGAQIIQEGSRSPADAFFTENTPVLEDLQEKGLLARIAPSTLRQVPARYSSPTGHWVGVSARVSVLVYNTDQVKASQLPSSILDLEKPSWKGKVGFAPTETDFQPLVTAITKVDGEAAAQRWLEGLKANGKIYPDNETLVSKVNSGQVAVGLINHYYWYRLRDELGAGAMHSALHHFAPGDVGGLVDVSGAAVIKSAGNPGAAQAFAAFLVSRAGQEIIAHSESWEYPIRPGVAAESPLPPLSSIKGPAVSLRDLGDGSAPLALEQKVGLL